MIEKQPDAVQMEVSSNSLFVYNFPCTLDHIPSVIDHPFLLHSFTDYRAFGTLNLNNEEQAVMAYYSNGPMPALDRTTHDMSTRKHLNKFGLKIFLTEPLCSHLVEDRYGEVLYHNFNFGFYSEFYNDEPNARKFRAKELDSIWKYVRRNALTNVTVATCDYNVDIHYPLYTNEMTLVYEDLFLKDLRIYEGAVDKPKTKITKKFICPTWRYTTTRYLLSTVLFDKDCYLSWFFGVPSNICEQSPWANSEEMKKYWPEFQQTLVERTNKMNRKAPYCIDLKASAATFLKEHAAHFYPMHLDNESFNGANPMNPVAVNEKQHCLESWYDCTFLSIHAESRFAQPTGNYSEKVIQSIQYKTPFLLVAPPFTLQSMKEEGFMTFDKWWDESYDLETNHLLRLKKIVKIIEWVDTLSHETLLEMHNEMLPLLEYNYQHAVDQTAGGHLQALPDEVANPSSVHVQWHSEWAETEFNNEE